MTDVFVDTSGWATLFVRSEPHHHLAVRLIADLLQQKRRIFTTNYVLAEFSAVLMSPIGLSTRHRHGILKRLIEGNWLETIQIDPEHDAESWEYLFSRQDKNYSLVDCSSFVAMKKLGVSLALTTDHHFEQAGFIRLLR